MICLKCRKGEFRETTAEVEQEFRGETFRVPARVSQCAGCGWTCLAKGQTDPLYRATVDAYRRKHGLLEAWEFRDYRRRLGWTQTVLAKLVGVNPTTVKRWETGQIQEPIYDAKVREVVTRALERLKMEPKWDQLRRYRSVGGGFRVLTSDPAGEVFGIRWNGWSGAEAPSRKEEDNEHAGLALAA